MAEAAGRDETGAGGEAATAAADRQGGIEVTPIVALDTETTGLGLDDDIWEFAAIRREADGTETELHLFIDHDTEKCARLPEQFSADHIRRFPVTHSLLNLPDGVVSKDDARLRIQSLMHGRPHVVGAVPNFDTERLVHRLRVKPEWHYHLIDVENLAVGYLVARANAMYAGSNGDDKLIAKAVELRDLATPPWKSDDLSRAVGVEPPGEGERHTAMGDARWALRLYDAIVGGA